MPQYNSLAALRGELTTDDPDGRADAYSAVLEAGTKPSEVLASEPSKETIRTLTDAGVIPAPADDRPAVAERWDRVIALLEQIAANTGGGS